MTREEVVSIVGEAWVLAVERENCECDCLVNDGTRESWSSTVLFNHGGYVAFNGEEYIGIKAVYYMDPELTTKKNDEDIDLGSLDWEIDHYELIG